jgi:predicted DNA-binding transcriptional regulator AlpA
LLLTAAGWNALILEKEAATGVMVPASSRRCPEATALKERHDVTLPTVAPAPARRKRLIRSREFCAKLDCSPQTLWRLQRTDPRFPQPGRLRGQTRVWTEDVADAYVELLSTPVGKP